MASKIKVDQLETADGSGTIALQNQLSGMTSASMPTGAVLQVVSTTKTDTFTTSSNSFVDITGMSVSITPSSTSSKIYVTANANVGNDAGTYGSFVRLVRDSTAIAVGDSSGSRTVCSTYMSYDGNQYRISGAASILYLDSPNTTSAVTYKLQMFSESASVTTFNRSGGDNDSSDRGRMASTITVMEIAG